MVGRGPDPPSGDQHLALRIPIWTNLHSATTAGGLAVATRSYTAWFSNLSQSIRFNTDQFAVDWLVLASKMGVNGPTSGRTGKLYLKP